MSQRYLPGQLWLVSFNRPDQLFVILKYILHWSAAEAQHCGSVEMRGDPLDQLVPCLLYTSYTMEQVIISAKNIKCISSTA